MRHHRTVLLLVSVVALVMAAPAGAAVLTKGQQVDPDAATSADAGHGARLGAEGLPVDPWRGTYFVTQQYRDLLGREPDAAGLDFWTKRLDAGLAPTSMVGELVDSPEFGRSRSPAARLDPAALGRFPDKSGWSYWSAQLAAGASLGVRGHRLPGHVGNELVGLRRRSTGTTDGRCHRSWRIDDRSTRHRDRVV